MFSAARFVWNATRGSRLRPWRSAYIKWRIETYSGLKAESLTRGDVLGFVWRERGSLMRFLKWTGEMEKAAGQENR